MNVIRKPTPVTVRIDRELEARLREIADAEGVSMSEVIRRAAVSYWEEHSGAALERRLADVIGGVASSGGRARNSGQAFKRLLERRNLPDREQADPGR